MAKKLKPYFGVLLSGLYALLLRFVFGLSFLNGIFDLFSISFVWLIPFVIGTIPFFFAPREKLSRWTYRVAAPTLAILVFFIFCFITRVEDLICLVILAFPYFLAAIVGGLLVGGLVMRYRDKKGVLYSFMLLPFIASLIEQQIATAPKPYSVVTKVLINASAEKIWQNIVRVSEIEESEYTKGFFNYAGIPRPLYAELNKDTLGATRIGHFEGGLKFMEKVTSWDRNKHIAFDISVVPSSIRQTVFDQHILKGSHFSFLNAAYGLKKFPNGQTELVLRSSYELNTNINGYASFWGNQLLTDFQERLLQVIKARCSKR